MKTRLTAGEAIYLKKRFLEMKQRRDMVRELNLSPTRLRQIEFKAVRKIMYHYNGSMWNKMS